MTAHLFAVVIAVPFQLGLGVINTRKALLTPGEVRFWCIVIFIMFDLLFLRLL